MNRTLGIGRLLIAVYAILALSASGRATFELVTKFDQAPLPYALSAVAALVYILATIALVKPGTTWRRIAFVTIWFEAIGVLLIGGLSLAIPELFTYESVSVKTVWSFFGSGYGYVPLVLPFLGLLWLRKHHS